jgi:hypothetical protein
MQTADVSFSAASLRCSGVDAVVAMLRAASACNRWSRDSLLLPLAPEVRQGCGFLILTLRPNVPHSRAVRVQIVGTNLSPTSQTNRFPCSPDAHASVTPACHCCHCAVCAPSPSPARPTINMRLLGLPRPRRAQNINMAANMSLSRWNECTCLRSQSLLPVLTPLAPSQSHPRAARRDRASWTSSPHNRMGCTTHPASSTQAPSQIPR